MELEPDAQAIFFSKIIKLFSQYDAQFRIIYL